MDPCRGGGPFLKIGSLDCVCTVRGEESTEDDDSLPFMQAHLHRSFTIT